jgi:UDP-N-acetylmuramate dehydrogenase
MIDTCLDQLRALFGNQLRLNEPLARYTAARLGGPADALISVDSAESLEKIARIVWACNAPVRILGGGANVLISDSGFRGIVIVNNAKDVAFGDAGLVTAESGAILTRLARQSMIHGLTGFEWAVSVPGTLGGAVVNNAGAHGGDMAAVLVSASIAFAGRETETWAVARIHYAYRESALKRNAEPFAVLSARLQLSPGHDPAQLEARADEFVAHRKRTQPPGASLGSMFKNPPGDYAGRLIEAAGLKGMQSGGVIISPVHANFFINLGNGTSSDYVTLINLAHDTVLEKFGVDLQLEVELVGFPSP